MVQWRSMDISKTASRKLEKFYLNEKENKHQWSDCKTSILFCLIFWWKLREKISVPSLIKVGNAKILL